MSAVKNGLLFFPRCILRAIGSKSRTSLLALTLEPSEAVGPEIQFLKDHVE